MDAGPGPPYPYKSVEKENADGDEAAPSWFSKGTSSEYLDCKDCRLSWAPPNAKLLSASVELRGGNAVKPSVDGLMDAPRPSVEPRAIQLEPGVTLLPTGEGDGEPAGDMESPAAATNAAKPLPLLGAGGTLASALRFPIERPLLALDTAGDLMGNWKANGLKGLGTFPAAL